jgi:hypothetical protein
MYMTRNPQQFERAAEFWGRHTLGAHLGDRKSLAALAGAIDAVEGKPTFSLEHIQAFTLAISVCEAQIRDCIRLAFDTPYMAIDTDNALLKDVSLDYTLLNSVRDHHFSLGEFFALNVSISTIGRFLSGAALGFPRVDFSNAYAHWEVTKAQKPQVTFDDLKSSLAFVFAQRNRFVHEFSELIAAEIGKPHDNERLVVPLRHVLLLLQFVQYLKTSYHDGAYNEQHPSRGAVGKELNALSAKIKNELDQLDAMLRNSRPDPVFRLPEALEVRKAIAALRSAHSEYLFRLGSFYHYVHGPGTIVNDFVYGAHLENLQQFEKHISWAVEHTGLLRGPPAKKNGTTPEAS